MTDTKGDMPTEYRTDHVTLSCECGKKTFRVKVPDCDALQSKHDNLLARAEKLREAFERQCDNMAFVLNHMDTGRWYNAFTQELTEDREALAEFDAERSI